MDKGTQDRLIMWNKIYQEKRDALLKNIGLSEGSSNPAWYKYFLTEFKDQLDLFNIVENDVEYFYNENERLNNLNAQLTLRLEKRDAEITDILTKMRNWIENYQPILDKVAEESNMLDRVKKDE